MAATRVRATNGPVGGDRRKSSALQTPEAVQSAGRGPYLVSAAHFLQATRDTGYKTTSLALAEFVDNSLQAGATEIAIEVKKADDASHPLEFLVVDNGIGMDGDTLAIALTFGGSTRFGDRSSLGRYGMGLPNAALSRARRVEVYTWRGKSVLMSRLDIDEMLRDKRRTLPPIAAVPRPSFVPDTRHGTVVRLQQCDRIELRRISTLTQRLERDLGRIYRRFLTTGTKLTINAQDVLPVDPMFLLPSGTHSGGRQFGDVLKYQLESCDGIGAVEVRFSELPIDRWHALSNEDKRSRGITNSPCVSVVRAGREIDRGWLFMGSKRRENYDDWWRCEISFDPVLDELFGLTHAKQAVSPREELVDVIAPDLEALGRALNARVRQRFELTKVAMPLGEAEKRAARADSALPALPRRKEPIPQALQQALDACVTPVPNTNSPYQIRAAELTSTAAFEIVVRGRQLVLVLNIRHPLYRDLYGPLATSDSARDQDTAMRLALALLAAARAEAAVSRVADRRKLQQFRQSWADVLATFFTA